MYTKYFEVHDFHLILIITFYVGREKSIMFSFLKFIFNLFKDLLIYLREREKEKERVYVQVGKGAEGETVQAGSC